MVIGWKRGVGYSRVSGVMQADGTSLESQTAACTALAESLGFRIDAEDMMEEVGSAINLDRDKLKRIRAMAAAGEFEGFFAYSTDRVSRDGVELLTVLREFSSYGVAVHFVRDPSDSSPHGELVKFVLGFCIEY